MLIALVVLAYILELLFLSFGIWRGYKMGLFKGLVRTAYLVLIIPISVFIAHLIDTPIATAFINLIRSSSNPTLSALSKSSPETFILLEAMAASIVFSVAFAILFGILELLSLIKFDVISSRIIQKFNDKQNSPLNKWGGIGIGFINGALSAAIILIPLCLVISTIGTSDAEALKALRIPTNSQNNVHHEKTFYVGIPSSLLLKTVTHISDNDIPEEYSEIKHKNLNMIDEGPNIINAVGYSFKAYTYSQNRGKDTKESILCAIGAANAHSGNSITLPSVLANIIRKAADAWEHGGSFLGITINVNNPVGKAFISKTLALLKNVNTNNIQSIVNTLMGDGTHDGVMSNMLSLQTQTQTQTNQEDTALVTLKENSSLIADSLVQLGKDKDLQSVNELVAEIGSEYITKIISQIFINNLNEKKINDFADSVTDYAQNNITVKTTEDYETHVSNVSQMIQETANIYNYKITDSESKIISIGLISFFYQTPSEDVTSENLLKHFGFSSGSIDDTANN